MGIRSITLSSSSDPEGVTLTPEQFERGTGQMTGRGAYGHIPADDDFENGDWLPAKDLEGIADRLIETKPDLAHLYDFQTVYFWKRTGGRKDGRAHIGQCSRVTGRMKAVAPGADYMIWLAADHCREMGMTVYQAEAFMFHEMMHTQADEKGRPRIRPHDWQGFDAEVREYGLYYDILQAAGTAFQQLSLAVA